MKIDVDELLIAPELCGGSYRTLVSIKAELIGNGAHNLSIRVGTHYQILGRI